MRTRSPWDDASLAARSTGFDRGRPGRDSTAGRRRNSPEFAPEMHPPSIVGGMTDAARSYGRIYRQCIPHCRFEPGRIVSATQGVAHLLMAENAQLGAFGTEEGTRRLYARVRCRRRRGGRYRIVGSPRSMRIMARQTANGVRSCIHRHGDGHTLGERDSHRVRFDVRPVDRSRPSRLMAFHTP